MAVNGSLVSVLIPCHNGGKYVGAAVESVLDQTWPNTEVIVVNDSSSDESEAEIQKFADRGIKLLSGKFGNASAARNHAFRHSSGDFIKFFDADDLLAPRTIELQMQRLGGSQTAVASAEWGRFRDDDVATLKIKPQSVWRDINSLDWLVEAWMDARPMMQPGIFLMSRPLLERSGLWDETLSLTDDFEFFARVLCRADEVRFVPGARLCYRSAITGSLSGRKGRRAAESAFHSLVKGTGHLLSRRQDENARLACANLLQDFIYTYYPEHQDLRRTLELEIEKLGGGNLPPPISPRFAPLCRLFGWKPVRRVQKWKSQVRQMLS
jgi:glycosyltransferase involved in cell wall biosynthesis